MKIIAISCLVVAFVGWIVWELKHAQELDQYGNPIQTKPKRDVLDLEFEKWHDEAVAVRSC